MFQLNMENNRQHQTLAFNSLMMNSIFNLANCFNQIGQFNLGEGLAAHPFFICVLLLAVFVQVMLTELNVFGLENLNPMQWFVCFVFALLSALIAPLSGQQGRQHMIQRQQQAKQRVSASRPHPGPKQLMSQHQHHHNHELSKLDPSKQKMMMQPSPSKGQQLMSYNQLTSGADSANNRHTMSATMGEPARGKTARSPPRKRPHTRVSVRAQRSTDAGDPAAQSAASG